MEEKKMLQAQKEFFGWVRGEKRDLERAWSMRTDKGFHWYPIAEMELT
jgi:hypothetical protein